MRLCRLLALLLGMLTVVFVAYEYSQDETGLVVLAGPAGAAAVIILGAILPIKRRINRLLLGGGIILYVIGVVAAIAISNNSQQSLMLRGALVGFMMSGLLLGIFWSHLSRVKPRRGFNNYYDR